MRAAASATSASAVSCAVASPLPLGEATLSAFVESWRVAQRSRDFASYSAHYAEHFVGLAWSGASFTRLKREDWLRARQPSFATTARAASAPVLISLGSGSAQITFRRGVDDAGKPGTSELYVIATNDGPKIAWEAPSRPAPSRLTESASIWLADEHAAILSATPDAAWADGAASYAGHNVATRSVALSRLPKSLRSWLGRPVRVLGANGAVCETRLQRFTLEAQITPDPRSAELWDGCADEHPISPEAIAQDIWRLSAVEGRRLVAEFSAPCKGAVFAVDPDQPVPASSAPEPASAELGELALAAFRRLPAYAAIEARFKAEYPDSASTWEDSEGRRGVWSMKLAAHPALLFVSVEAGSGCGGFSASLSALWEVRGDGASSTLVLLALPTAEDDRRLIPSAVVDLDGSGQSSVLLGPDGLYAARSLLRGGEAGYRRDLLSSVPFFGGPC